MYQSNPFTIYNASAGSGKTYTLVKEYLKILFQSQRPDYYKRILAITFTNKAVAEMKERIVETLTKFSDTDILESNDSMFNSICKELDIQPASLRKKSEILLHSILHNYAAFDISTIDGFTHKIIRTFAHDLKLPLNFEVELDQETLLNEAVDSLISKAGIDKNLTNTLVDFAIEKADDDKSWNLTLDFNKIAKLLVNENDVPFIETLKNKTLDDFEALKKQLRIDIKATEKDIIENGQEVLDLIYNSGLEDTNFSRKLLPNHFKKVVALNINSLYGNNLEENIIERKGVYTKTLDASLANTIDTILPEIELKYLTIKRLVYHLKFIKNAYKNITPLSVLNAINNELNTLKESQNKMLISEFNSIISKEIKNQPTPFIYERIGEKFKHYFIDEFQDTSEMQWKNLIPLIDNSLSSENGTTMLVGDAKQAIYRWRGGKAEQFINLFNNKITPFQTNQDVKSLEENYRSFKEVVSFNNGLFQFLSDKTFGKDDYQLLYQNANQNITKNESGFVSLSFLNIDKDDDRNEVFPVEVLKTVQDCLNNGFNYDDICILVRKKKEGIAISNYLSLHNIPIISSETLLINNAAEVDFINNVLNLLIKPKNNEVKIKVLNYLSELFHLEDKHTFFSNHINLSTSQLLKSLEDYNIHISYEALLQLPLYDLTETIVRSFNLVTSSNAYIQFYLDIVLDFSQKKDSDISSFLEYFEKKKDNLSIISPKGQNAVQIMTIHKSKGLEFPVVIFPYADLDIYKEVEPKEWFKMDKGKYNNLQYALLNYTKDFEHFGEEGFTIFNKHQSELELDNINLLYVVLTRAVEQLHIISKKDISPKGAVNTKKYSGLFISYLQHLTLWDESELYYKFGSPEKASESNTLNINSIIHKEFISTSKEAHNIKIITKSGSLWDTNQQEAIKKGNLIHDIMALINTKNDIDLAFNDFLKNTKISQEQIFDLKKTITQIVSHPELKDYYGSSYTYLNERDIICKDGTVLRPDRLAINSNKEVIIIDYKTGVENKKHVLQIQQYQNALELMNLKVIRKILVYVSNSNISIKKM